MATNKVATVVLLDVGASMSEPCESETFFKKCQWCLLRIIQRKIFSDENDELAIVLFGCKETENRLAQTTFGGMYENICEYVSMQIPDWDIYEKVQKLSPTDITNSNWIECLVVGLSFMKDQTRGKRFKDKQVLVLSNFCMELEANKINSIAESINLDNLKLIVIGVDLEEECEGKVLDSQLSGSIGAMLTLIDKVENGVSLSFTEAEDDIIYYEKKRKLGKFTKVNLTIGSRINIPIRWIKLNLEPTRIKWIKKPPKLAAGEAERNVEAEVKFIMDSHKVTKFGESEVILSYADLEAMKRKTGPPSCILLGCVKRQRISRKMLVGKDMYQVVCEKSPRAQAMLSAFIDALIDADKYALVRRISINNGKVKIGVLVPVSDEVGKTMYFLQLPFADHAMTVPDGVLPEPNNNEVLTAIDQLIDAMTIPDNPKDIIGKDPNFQLRSHVLHLVATGQLKDADRNMPDFIKKLRYLYPELLADALPHIKTLESLLPIRFNAKTQDQNNDNVVLLKDVENEGDTLKNDQNKPGVSSKVEDMDWVNAETQEWPDETKQKYSSIAENSTIPSLMLKKEFLWQNKYEKDYVSSRLWKEHGPKQEIEQKKETKFDFTPGVNDSDIRQLVDGRQDTDIDHDTNDMLQRIKANLETK